MQFSNQFVKNIRLRGEICTKNLNKPDYSREIPSLRLYVTVVKYMTFETTSAIF
jgi:hypothetical protein